MAIETFRLDSRETIVIVQSVGKIAPPLSDWQRALSLFQEIDLERKKNPKIKIRLMAFSDGVRPEESTRDACKETLVNWKMPIIIHQPHTVLGQVLNRVMGWWITRLGTPASCFSSTQIAEVFKYMDLERGEQENLKRKLIEFGARHRGHLALNEFVTCLQPSYQRASNSLAASRTKSLSIVQLKKGAGQSTPRFK